MASFPKWTRDEDKLFEAAFVSAMEQYPEGSTSFFDDIAKRLNKPFNEVKYYYEALVHDVDMIDSGKVALPKYPEDDYVSLKEAIKSKNQGREKRKGTPWSPEEHMLFLDGLQKYGKGDWKSISREYVKTRTSTQVASHAQKYFLRQILGSNRGKRSSIHDIVMTTLPQDAQHVTTVPAGSILMNSMEQQQHFGDQIPPDQFYHHQNSYNNNFQANVTVPVSSNLNLIGQQVHFGDQIPPDQYYHYQNSHNNFQANVIGSNLNLMGQQPHFGDQILSDQYYHHQNSHNNNFQTNVTVPVGSNLNPMDQHPHFGDQIPPDHYDNNKYCDGDNDG